MEPAALSFTWPRSRWAHSAFSLPLAWRIGARFKGNSAARDGGGENAAGKAVPPRSSRRRRRASSGLGTGRSRRQRSPAQGRASAASLACQPVSALALRGVLPVEHAGHAQQPSVRGRGRHVTAWNFGEWAAAIKRSRHRAGAAHETNGGGRVSTCSPALHLCGACRSFVLLWRGSARAGSSGFTGEGRTISLGEEPFFFPHEAARFAGSPGMPDRCLAFHNGNASVYEYYHGPERQGVHRPAARGRRRRSLQAIHRAPESHQQGRRPAGRPSSPTWGAL